MTKSNLCKFAVVFAVALFVSLGVEGARVNKFNLGSSSPSSYTHTVRYGTAEIIPAVVINEYEVAPPPAGKVARITIATTSSNLSPTTSSGCFKVQVGSPLAEWHYISGSYTIESSSSKWLRLEAHATPGTYAALYTSYYHLSYSYQVTYTISVTYANPTPPPADLVVENGVLISASLNYCSIHKDDLVIPSGIREIGDDNHTGVFYNYGITKVTIPSTVTSIGPMAFFSCDNLTDVILSEGLVTIGEGAFRDAGIKNIRIPYSVETIGESAFHGNSALASVTMQNGVKQLGWSAFYGCSSLTSVKIPATVTKIGVGAFSGCTNLRSVYFEGNAPTMEYYGGYAFKNVPSSCCVYVTRDSTGWGVDIPGTWVDGVRIDYYDPVDDGCKMKVTVTFDGGGGSGYMSPVTQTIDFCKDTEVAYEFPECEYEKEGCRFAGWDVRDACSMMLNPPTYPVGYLWPLCGNMTLTATWETDEMPDLCFHPASGSSQWPAAVFLSDASDSMAETTTFAEGTPIYLHARFRNGGAAAIAQNYKIVHEVYSQPVLDKTGVGLPAGALYYDSATYECTDGNGGWLAAGAGMQWNGSLHSVLQNLPAGFYIYECRLDSEDDVAESDEDNNVAMVWFTVEEHQAAYSVTFDANGGKFSNGAATRTLSDLTPGNLWGKLPMPAKSGYVFDGYYTALADGTMVTASSAVPDYSTTYYARWTPRLGLAAASEWSGAFETDSWCGQGSVAYDGQDALRSGIIYDNQSSYIMTRVSGAGTFSFWWAVSCEGQGYDKLGFLVDGVQKYAITGETDWTRVTVNIAGSGTHTLKWVYSKDSSGTKGEDFGWIDQLKWTPSVSPGTVTFNANGGKFSNGAATRTVAATPGNLWGKMPMPAMDGYVFTGWHTAQNGGMQITSSSQVPNAVTTYYAHWTPRLGLAAASEWSREFTTDSWCGQGAVSHDGRDALRSGIIYDNQSSYILTRVPGPGVLTFWWKVSCEAGGNDALRLLVDGAQVNMISGDVDWTKVEVPITGSGTHLIKWNYTKNGSVTKGEDFGWIDQISWRSR